MVTSRCDLCKQNTNTLKSIVLHKKVYDYCPNCEKKAEKIKEDFKQVMKQEYIMYESRLKKAEQDFYYNKIKKYE